MENFNSILDAPETKQHYRYAGFWERFAAAFIDGILLLFIQSIIFSVFGTSILSAPDPEAIGASFGTAYLLSLAVSWLYFALLESGEKQSTLGKRALDLRVTDAGGGRISFGQATGRHFGKYVSALMLLIGYLIQPFTERKQALHDLMAGTLVVKNRGWGN